MRRPEQLRKPSWLKIRPPSGQSHAHIKGLRRSLQFHTVCEEAQCPNLAECWGAGTATFMLLGDVCTRGCRFCDVRSGNPGGVLDFSEPEKVAEAVCRMKLEYVVLTSVDRDDLPDGGAKIFAKTIEAIRHRNPQTRVEALIPDFAGDDMALAEVLEAQPDVIGHNIETVERLTPRVRDRRASYLLSLSVLEKVKALDSRIYTKSSIMVGLGETQAEVIHSMKDLRRVHVELLTLGQYLRPSLKHLEVVEYVTPAVFEQYKQDAMSLDFLHVASGPLVRSSYRASEMFMKQHLE